MKISEAKSQLVTVSHAVHARGWVPATSGNFSMRLEDGDIAITVSGKNKGELALNDIMRMTVQGMPKEPKKPSAEALLHARLYERDRTINAVLHTHSVGATIASQIDSQELQFRGLEILKAFSGISAHCATLTIPIFKNTQDIAALADHVERYMLEHGQGVAYLIAGHGVYTWGPNIDCCTRQLEALEYLFEYDRKNCAQRMENATQ